MVSATKLDKIPKNTGEITESHRDPAIPGSQSLWKGRRIIWISAAGGALAGAAFLLALMVSSVFFTVAPNLAMLCSTFGSLKGYYLLVWTATGLVSLGIDKIIEKVAFHKLRKKELNNISPEFQPNTQSVSMSVKLSLVGFEKMCILQTSSKNFQGMMCEGVVDGIQVLMFVGCKDWKKLKVTEEEKRLGVIDVMQHIHEMAQEDNAESHVGIFSLINGITTKEIDFYNRNRLLAGEHPGNPFVISLYNQTLMFTTDASRVGFERKGYKTQIVSAEVKFLQVMASKLQDLNASGKQRISWEYVAHSEGGLILRNALYNLRLQSRKKLHELDQLMKNNLNQFEDLKKISSELQELNANWLTLRQFLHIFAVAPAEPIPQELAACVVNIYSKADYVTGAGLLASEEIKNENENFIRKLQSQASRRDRNAGIADHRMVSPTYLPEILTWFNSMDRNFEVRRDDALEEGSADYIASNSEGASDVE